ncbi:hypothetical protein [Streptomyces sp. NPDC059455]|uniref:hypothetical protein n=1 Tax=Streptomyces sp. NPDC059455 TaxID=3346837 RepID=UPI0036C6DA2E
MFPRVASPRFLALAGTVVLMLVAPFTKVRPPRRRDLPMVALCGATGMTALPDTAAPHSLHPLVRPVSRTLFTVSRAGTGNRPDLRHVLDLLRDLVPVPDGDGESAPRG